MTDKKIHEFKPPSNASSAASESAPEESGSPTRPNDRPELSQAAQTDPFSQCITEAFSAFSEANVINGYLTAIADVMKLVNRRVPVTHDTLIAMTVVQARGGDREARLRAAWEAA